MQPQQIFLFPRNQNITSLGKALLFENIYPAFYRKYNSHDSSLSEVVICQVIELHGQNYSYLLVRKIC